MARYLVALAAALTLALSPAASAQSGVTQTDQAVNVCHAVGDSYQLISVSGNALQTHVGHAGDIVPAPAGGCPATSPYTSTDQLPPALSPTPTAGTRDEDEDEDDRLGEEAGGGRAPAGGGGAGELPVISERSRAIDGIPLTGAPADLIFLIGIGMVMTGLGGRLAFRSL